MWPPSLWVWVYVVRAARPRDDGGRAGAQRAVAQALGLRGMWSWLVCGRGWCGGAGAALLPVRLARQPPDAKRRPASTLTASTTKATSLRPPPIAQKKRGFFRAPVVPQLSALSFAISASCSHVFATSLPPQPRKCTNRPIIREFVGVSPMGFVPIATNLSAVVKDYLTAGKNGFHFW